MTRALLVAAALAAAGCATFDPAHPSAGAPSITTTHAGYWIWYGGARWHLRAVAGDRAHRFQGTVVGASGSVTELTPSDAALAEQVALVGDAVQFDFEAAAGQPGFDLRVAGGCARFDLLLDGKRAPARVHVGARAQPAGRVPFERCP